MNFIDIPMTFTMPFGPDVLQVIEPPVDVTEFSTCFVIHSNMPGVKSSDVDLDLSNNVLTITAISKEEGEGTPLQSEFGSVKYVRQFRLAKEIDKKHIKAYLKDGVLSLTLPKLEKNTLKQINITT